MSIGLGWALWPVFIMGILIPVLPKRQESLAAPLALFAGLINLFVVVFIVSSAGVLPQMEHSPLTIVKEWIPSFHIFYRLGIDGISGSVLLLSAILFPIAVASSWKTSMHRRAFFSLLLMLQGCINGVFLSLDLFLFFIFWEFMLVPMYFLIAIWGGENKEYAAIKFFIYTFAASIFLLIAIIAMFFQTGMSEDSFNLLSLQGGIFRGQSFIFFGYQVPFETLLFFLFFFAFAVKLPIVPFHTWLPHAHVQAPTAVSVILAGVLLKMGGYGFLRISYAIIPDTFKDFSHFLAILGIINILYGGYCAMAQNDLKKLVAYSSVAHMGFVLIGIASLNIQGISGAVLEMFNHGTSSAMLFLLVGILSYQSNHRWIIRPDGTRGFSGLAKLIPKFTFVFCITMFASMGLPGLSGFISESIIFMGAIQRFGAITVLMGVGLLIGAVYLIWAFARMFFGKTENSFQLYDLSPFEVLYLAPLVVMMIVLGIYPGPLIDFIQGPVNSLLFVLGHPS